MTSSGDQKGQASGKEEEEEEVDHEPTQPATTESVSYPSTGPTFGSQPSKNGESGRPDGASGDGWG